MGVNVFRRKLMNACAKKWVTAENILQKGPRTAVETSSLFQNNEAVKRFTVWHVVRWMKFRHCILNRPSQVATANEI